MRRVRRIHVLVAAVLVAGAISGGAFAVASSVRANVEDVETADSAVEMFDVLAQPAERRNEPELAHLAGSLPSRGDMSRLRVLASDVGRFDSRLVMFPSADDSTICYALLGQTTRDPGMSVCHQPHATDLPPALAGQHFNAVGLGSVIEGKPGVQVFGVAADDVESLRVQVAGEWSDLPITNNGFYLDLPGVRHAEVGIVEAKLADGSVQVHDIQNPVSR